MNAIGALGVMLLMAPIHLDDTRGRQWHLTQLSAASAHELTRGEGVIVAVIDSGVDADHPDLVGNVIPGTVTAPGEAGSGTRDENGHGTAIAGIIAAHGHGGGGVLGMAPRAKILPIRVSFALTEGGDRSGIPSAIDYAVSHNARIINLSLAGQHSELLRRAVERALAADVVIVAGAGNKSGSLEPPAPATYSGVLAAAAVDRTGSLAPFSIPGPEVAIAAPGVDIVTTGLKGSYISGSGTSEATAIVSGAAALVRSKFPNLSAAEVVHRLTATATDAGAPGRDEEYGYGVLNLIDALTKDVPPLQSSPSVTPTPTTAVATPGPSATHRGVPPAVLVAVVLLVLLAAGGTWTAMRRRNAG